MEQPHEPQRVNTRRIRASRGVKEKCNCNFRHSEPELRRLLAIARSESFPSALDVAELFHVDPVFVVRFQSLREAVCQSIIIDIIREAIRLHGEEMVLA